MLTNFSTFLHKYFLFDSVAGERGGGGGKDVRVIDYVSIAELITYTLTNWIRC